MIVQVSIPGSGKACMQGDETGLKKASGLGQAIRWPRPELQPSATEIVVADHSVRSIAEFAFCGMNQKQIPRRRPPRAGDPLLGMTTGARRVMINDNVSCPSGYGRSLSWR